MSAAIINLAYLLAVALFVLGLKAAVASAQGGLTSHPFILVIPISKPKFTKNSS
jgi:hypothetical protein